jgi:hypothetical protein
MPPQHDGKSFTGLQFKLVLHGKGLRYWRFDVKSSECDFARPDPCTPMKSHFLAGSFNSFRARKILDTGVSMSRKVNVILKDLTLARKIGISKLFGG